MFVLEFLKFKEIMKLKKKFNIPIFKTKSIVSNNNDADIWLQLLDKLKIVMDVSDEREFLDRELKVTDGVTYQPGVILVEDVPEENRNFRWIRDYAIENGGIDVTLEFIMLFTVLSKVNAMYDGGINFLIFGSHPIMLDDGAYLLELNTDGSSADIKSIIYEPEKYLLPNMAVVFNFPRLIEQ